MRAATTRGSPEKQQRTPTQGLATCKSYPIAVIHLDFAYEPHHPAPVSAGSDRADLARINRGACTLLRREAVDRKGNSVNHRDFETISGTPYFRMGSLFLTAPRRERYVVCEPFRRGKQAAADDTELSTRRKHWIGQREARMQRVKRSHTEHS